MPNKCKTSEQRQRGNIFLFLTFKLVKKKSDLGNALKIKALHSCPSLKQPVQIKFSPLPAGSLATSSPLQVIWPLSTIWGWKLSSKFCGFKQLNRLTRAQPRTIRTVPFPQRLYLLSCLYLTSGPALCLKGIKRERKRREMKTRWICFQHWSHSCLELQRVVRETFFSILMPCSPLRHNQEAAIFSNKLKPAQNESGFLLAISNFFPLTDLVPQGFFCLFEWNFNTCSAKQQPLLLQFFQQFFYFFLLF